MTDVAPYSLGVAVSRHIGEGHVSTGHFDPVIERNSPVPLSRSENYRPMSLGQQGIDLQVYQGESRMVKDNVHLGSLHVPLPQGYGADQSIDVRFTYDVNGLLQVEATVSQTLESFTLVIEGNPGVLTPDEIQNSLRAMDALKVHPRDQLENRTALARAERIYRQLRGNKREWLDQRIAEFEHALASQERKIIVPALRRLEEHLQRIESDSYLAD